MGTELTLSYASAALLQQDFEANLRKGRAFVPGVTGLGERDPCTLRIEPPGSSGAHCVRAEAVWRDTSSPGGTGLSFLDFDADAQSALRAFVEAVVARADGVGSEPDPLDDGVSREPAAANAIGAAGPIDAADPVDTEAVEAFDRLDAREEDDAPGEPASASGRAARNLHDRVRELDLTQREALARQGSMPERVALERRYGSSVWEGLLHNPQITPREVLRIAKSTSLPTSLVSLVVSNRAWLADTAISQALLANPRVSGTHLDRVLRALPQSELLRIAEQSSLRMQVRQAAKRLIRR